MMEILIMRFIIAVQWHIQAVIFMYLSQRLLTSEYIHCA
jgi:hypothetical protein